MAPLFQHMQFYLSRTLSATDRIELKQLIEQEGGTVSSTPAGAVQLVDCEAMDARHPERISTAFVKDSIASQSLQQLSSYSGSIFTTQDTECARRETPLVRKRQGRLKYTVEDDARMLHFAKLRGWRSMQSVPESAWRLAENDRVTAHSGPSMHEHFRKKLQRKTPMEQRLILAQAAAMARSRMLEKEPAVAQEETKGSPRTRVDSSETPLRNAATTESTMAIQASQQPMSSGSIQSRAATLETPTVETRRQTIKVENCSQRDKRTRSRKPFSPLRNVQRIQTDTGAAPFRDVMSTAPIDAILGQSVPAMPIEETSVDHATQRGPERSDQSTDRKQEKRKRGTPSTGVAVIHHQSPSRPATDASSASSVETETRKHDGIFFRSAWTELVHDRTKRRMLQELFEPCSTPSSAESHASSTGSAVTRLNTTDGSTTDIVRERSSEARSRSPRIETVEEQATDEEADHIICQLQFDTHQDIQAVVHAIYYCSGDPDMARSFLKGAMPLGMWSAEDDLLLTNLVAEDVLSRVAVDTAVTRGDFASMRVPRDTDAIMKRVQFLR
uniref:BRCT domain-containing protein n=1 Tax=Peronospora matthiolae TaxID=2874970 RepID=A0AAV1VDH8_9STRA